MSTIQICKVKEPDLSAGTIPFSFSTNDLDRDSEVVMPMGVVMTNFARNPVFLWSHDRYTPAIGKVLVESIQLSEKELAGVTQFDRKDPFAELIFNKYAEGFLSATSIGFRVVEFGPPILEGQRGATIRVWEWMESSAVNIPANPSALRKEYDLAVSGKYPAHGEPYYKAIKDFYEGLKQKEAQEYLEKQVYIYMETSALANREKEKHDPGKAKVSAEEALRRINEGADDEQKADAFPDGESGFIHHDFINGEFSIHWELLRAAMVKLLTGSDELDPEKKQKIYDHLAAHYQELGKEPPELVNAEPKVESKPRTAEELLKAMNPEEINSIIDDVIHSLTTGGYY